MNDPNEPPPPYDQHLPLINRPRVRSLARAGAVRHLEQSLHSSLIFTHLFLFRQHNNLHYQVELMVSYTKYSGIFSFI